MKGNSRETRKKTKTRRQCYLILTLDKKYTWWLRNSEEDLKCGASCCRAQASRARSSSEHQFLRLRGSEAKQATQPGSVPLVPPCLLASCWVQSTAFAPLKGVIVSKKISQNVTQTVSWDSGDSDATLLRGVVTYLCQSRHTFKTQILFCFVFLTFNFLSRIFLFKYTLEIRNLNM